MESKEIDKIVKPKKKSLIIGLIFLVITMILIGIGTYLDRDRNLTPKDFHELIYNNKDIEKEYVKINLAYPPFSFAIKNDTLTFYFVSDIDNYLYIARLTEETYKKIDELYEQNPDDFNYQLEGYIYTIPEDIKPFAVKTYNEVYEEEILTLANLEEYVGNTYLDETITPYTQQVSIVIICGVVSAFLTLVFLIVGTVNFIKTKKKLKSIDIDELKSALAKATTVEYPKIGIYLTDQYLISNSNSLTILKYEDILWLYNEKRRVNGVYVGTYLKGVTNKKKTLILGYTRKQVETLEEIMQKVYEKNKEVMIGFTGENQKKYKEFKKRKKD